MNSETSHTHQNLEEIFESVYFSFPNKDRLKGFPEIWGKFDDDKFNTVADVCRELLLMHNLSDFPQELFYDKVIDNAEIKDSESLQTALQLLSVSDSPQKDVNSIVEFIYKYQYCKNFAELVDLCAELNVKYSLCINEDNAESALSYSDYIPHTTYEGKYNFPENCHLIQSLSKLKEAQNKSSLDLFRLWTDIVDKKYFLIEIKPDNSLFIQVYYNDIMDLFLIKRVLSGTERNINRSMIKELTEAILSPDNQLFFRENSEVSKDIINTASSFLFLP